MTRQIDEIIRDFANYASARHVPDMERGFTIHTSYGELWIEGEEARRHPEVMDGILAILEERAQQAMDKPAKGVR